MDIDLEKYITNEGNTLNELGKNSPLLVVFLRHFGCLFCREALHDISSNPDIIANDKIKIVLVHMASTMEAEDFFGQSTLRGIEHISDPELKMYNDFGLTKGTFRQLFGLNTWIRGYEVMKKDIPFSNSQIGDSFQMPGIFLIKENKVVASYIHKRASDRPDYNKLISSRIV